MGRIGQAVRRFFYSTERLIDRIKQSAHDSTKVYFMPHAQDRMKERGILDSEVFRVLRNGDVRGEIENARETGGKKVKMVHLTRGNREVGVVVVILSDSRLKVITVQWEDFS